MAHEARGVGGGRAEVRGGCARAHVTPSHLPACRSGVAWQDALLREKEDLMELDDVLVTSRSQTSDKDLRALLHSLAGHYESLLAYELNLRSVYLSAKKKKEKLGRSGM